MHHKLRGGHEHSLKSLIWALHGLDIWSFSIKQVNISNEERLKSEQCEVKSCWQDIRKLARTESNITEHVSAISSVFVIKQLMASAYLQHIITSNQLADSNGSVDNENYLNE